jgi:nitroimidazol reductase NimA-like FMN-containing flavoprotein (pyridoxamine 5'-phosphate oxidase superfamily)
VAEKTFIDSAAEIEKILREETLGFLGLASAGEPYVVPVTYCYHEGRIIFHGALTGKKLDFIRDNPEVCFAVARETSPPVGHEGSCELESESVICYGTARILENLDEQIEALELFRRRYSPERRPITPEDATRCSVVEISVRELTGRRETGGECSYWRHRFE